MSRRRLVALTSGAALLAAGLTSAILVAGSGAQATSDPDFWLRCSGSSPARACVEEAPPTTTVVTTTTVPGPTTTVTTTPAATTTAPVSYVKILDSANAYQACGGTPGTITCPIHKDDLGGGMGRGDSFSLTCSDYCRDTWVDLRTFSRGKISDWTFLRRWTRHDPSNSGHFAIGELRQDGPETKQNCEGGGNAHVQAITTEIDQGSPEHYGIWVRGGPTMWQSDSSEVNADLGPVDPVGSIHTWRFRILFDYAHGSITVWKDGSVVFTRPDIPIGFHYACDRVTVVAQTYRSQFGVYTHSTGTQILDETSWRFRCYEATSCP